MIPIVLLILAAATVAAQTPEAAQRALPVRPNVPCPHPTTRTLTITTPAQVLSEFPASIHAAISNSQLNSPRTDTAFGHTFRFPVEGCCIWTRGELRVTIKALQGGPANSSTSANDAVNVYAGTQNIAFQQPWKNTGVATGAVTTVTFQFNATQLAGGMLSIYVQDDSSVQSAELILEGCCLKPQK
jgi:hypothetical protein